MKREEELTVSEKAEDWENACHELIWLVGDTELFERISNAARLNAEQRPVATPKPLNLGITKEWFDKRAAKEGDLEIGAGVSSYIPGFIPSEADKFYGRVIDKLYARIAELEAKPEPVGWETDAEWELEMRCANLTENTPFAEVSKLINDLWQQYCLAAEPKGVDHQVHHSKPVVSQNTQIVERDIYEVANQLGGYVGPDTPERLKRFLLKEEKAAAALADEIVRLRSELANARNMALILREALEQFIWGDETIETILFGEFKDDRRMTFTIPIGALRRARAALKAEGESR